ncbi:hypothetical protein CBER1_02516 [Cercospora berteroae]|uniref:Uncharacterized protein n=1 Tax=Cercospora berteroae TaxID=357750 RepID=A0A2S6C468_9PEZI|nr:hypothetical protein CBER1_02516 [Cercospora berteroae]
MHTLFTIFALLIATTSAVSKRHVYGHSHGHGHGHELRHLSAYGTSRHVDSVEETTARCLQLENDEGCDEANGQHNPPACSYWDAHLKTTTELRLSRASYDETPAKTAPHDIKAIPEQPDAYGRPGERTVVPSDADREIERTNTESRNQLSTADKIVTTKPTPAKSPSEPTLDAYSVTNFFPYSPSGFKSPSPQPLPESRNLEYRANELPSPYATLQHRANDIPSPCATLHQRAEEPTPYHMLPRSANGTLPSPSTPTQQNSNATTPTVAPTQQYKNGTVSASRTSTLQDPQNTDEAAPTHGDLFQKPNAASGIRGAGWGIAAAALVAAAFGF